MQKFLKVTGKFLLFPCIVLLGLVLLYIFLDPFKVLRPVELSTLTRTKGRVFLNRDFVSTSVFDRNATKYPYSSFIFGNSRSIFYKVSDWRPFLPEGSSCFHFDASDESLYGIAKKISYIDKKGMDLKNVLMILDYGTLVQNKPGESHLNIISPQLEDNKNLLKFHQTFFLAFLQAKFLFSYIDFLLSKQVKPYMKKSYLIDDRPFTFIDSLNEIHFDHFDSLLEVGKYYTPERMAFFYKRDSVEKISPPAIGAPQVELLQQIARIFKKHGTNCRIIINPLYDQKKLNPQDLKYLKSTFGQNNVFDFSGKNEITDSYTNYYEDSHYRTCIASKLMREVYR